MPTKTSAKKKTPISIKTINKNFLEVMLEFLVAAATSVITFNRIYFILHNVSITWDYFLD